MKHQIWVVLMCMIFACDTEEQNEIIQSEWNMVWSLNQDHAFGNLLLLNDRTAVVEVFENHNSLLTTGHERIQYEWELTDDKFIMKRLDNHFLISYNVVSNTDEQMELLYADEVKLSLIRK